MGRLQLQCPPPPVPHIRNPQALIRGAPGGCFVITDVFRVGEVMDLAKFNGTWAFPQLRKVFISDVFQGLPEALLRDPAAPDRSLPPANCLSAYPGPFGSTFLGFIVDQRRAEECRQRKLASLAARELHGVVWGKEARYFERRWDGLRWLARNASAQLGVSLRLHTTVSGARGYNPSVFQPDLVQNHHMLTRAQFSDLLCHAHFLLGLGNPIMGPTALEALANGAGFFNPRFARPHNFSAVDPRHSAGSQHPYLDGKPGVCGISWESPAEFEATALRCLREAASPEAYSFPPTALSP